MTPKAPKSHKFNKEFGIYTPLLTKKEKMLLSQLDQDDLSQEIALFRSFIYTLFELTGNVKDIHLMIRIVQLISNTMAKLSRVMLIQKGLNEEQAPGDELESIFTTLEERLNHNRLID